MVGNGSNDKTCSGSRWRTKTAAAEVDGDGGGEDNGNSDRQHMPQKWTSKRLLITKKQYRGIGDRERDDRK